MTRKSYHVLVSPVHSERKTLVVLGAPRGGTSVVSGVLRIAGVFMGEDLGHQHEDPAFRQEVPLEQKINTIREQNAQYKVWGWKLPNTIYYLKAVFPLLRNPHLIVVYRDPFSIALSSANRDKRPLTQQLLEVPIGHYRKMHQVITEIGECPRFVCSYEELFKDKNEFLGGLFCFCDLHPPTEHIIKCLEFMNPEKGYQCL